MDYLRATESAVAYGAGGGYGATVVAIVVTVTGQRTFPVRGNGSEYANDQGNRAGKIDMPIARPLMKPVSVWLGDSMVERITGSANRRTPREMNGNRL